MYVPDIFILIKPSIYISTSFYTQHIPQKNILSSSFIMKWKVKQLQ